MKLDSKANTLQNIEQVVEGLPNKLIITKPTK